jgi:glycosyltransferase involved in cell wall biosynthesis
LVRVSIIVPVYNTEKYLKKCLDSLVNQTLEDIEIIAINDGSKDNSLSILRDYEVKYKNKFKVIDSINQGVGKARNLGIEDSSGEYIWFVDSDDWLEKDAVEKMYNAAKKYNVSMVTCQFQRRIGILKRHSETDMQSGIVDFNQDPDQLIEAKPGIGNKLIKRSLLGDIRMPGLKWEDLSFTFAVVADSNKAYRFADKLYNYRASLYSTSIRDKLISTSRITEIFDVLAILEQHFKDRGLYEKYYDQFKNIYIISALNRLVDANTCIKLSKENKKVIINSIVNMIELKYSDIDIYKIINGELPYNPISTYFLRKNGLPLLDENMRQETSEEQIKENIVKQFK